MRATARLTVARSSARHAFGRSGKTFHIGIQYPVHAFAGNRHTQRIKRVVLAATRPTVFFFRGIAEAEKILLVNGLQYPQHGLLDDLVFQ